MSTSALASACAAAIPPKPPPTMATLRRSPDTGDLLTGHAEAREQVIAHPQRVGHGGQRRVDRADAREEARVDDVEVVDLVRAAVRVEHRGGRIEPEPARPRLVGHPGHRDL